MFFLIDFILNVAGLLLWLNWRSIRHDPFVRLTPGTFAGTVRRAEPMRLRRWHFLAALGLLLLFRAFFYVVVGPEVNWVPKLDLLVIAPAFRANHFLPVFIYSVLSFVCVLVIFYFWLVMLAVINRRVTAPDPIHKLALLQLGPVARWPLVAQLVAPVLIVAALWMLLHPLLIYVGVTNHVRSISVLMGQGLAVGVSIFFSLKFLLPAILFVYVIISYVYLGASPLWEFVSVTSRNLLSALRLIPLRLGKVDFAPIVGILLILLLLEVVPTWVFRELAKHNLTVWPQ